MTDIIGGQVKVGIDTASAARSFVNSGKLKVLGVTSIQQSALLPQAQTVASQGVDDFQVIAWNGLYAPHGTPPAILQKLSTELAKIMAQPDIRQKLLDLGHEPSNGLADELKTFAASERVKWGPLVKSAGIKVD